MPSKSAFLKTIQNGFLFLNVTVYFIYNSKKA